MILLSQELLLLFLKTKNSCSKPVKHSLVSREGAATGCCRQAGHHDLASYCAEASQLNEELTSVSKQECLLSSTKVAVIVLFSLPVAAHRLNTLPVINLHRSGMDFLCLLLIMLQRFFYLFQKQVQICSFLQLLNFTLQNMYDSPGNGMIQ